MAWLTLVTRSPLFSPPAHLWQGGRGACAHVLVHQALEGLRQQPGCVQHQAGGRADLGQHLHLGWGAWGVRLVGRGSRRGYPAPGGGVC